MKKLLKSRAVRKDLADAAIAGIGIVSGLVISLVTSIDPQIAVSIGGFVTMGTAWTRRAIRDWQRGPPG